MSDRFVSPSPSDSLLGFLRSLHPVTQGLTWVAILDLFATIISIIGKFQVYDTRSSSELVLPHLADYARSVSYSLLMLGTPASVEFLYRISVEVRLMRLAKGADPAEN